MILKRSLTKQAARAARRMRADRPALAEQIRRVRLYAADFVAESENIEGANMTSADVLKAVADKK